MVDCTLERNDSNILMHDFSGMPEMHASAETLNFLRFFAANFKPMAEA